VSNVRIDPTLFIRLKRACTQDGHKTIASCVHFVLSQYVKDIETRVNIPAPAKHTPLEPLKRDIQPLPVMQQAKILDDRTPEQIAHDEAIFASMLTKK